MSTDLSTFAAASLACGLLTEALSWRWIFLVNLPICVAALVMCRVALRPDGARRPGTFDLWGTVTFTVAAGTLTYAVIRADVEGWSSPRTWGLLAVAALALAAFALIEKYGDNPMFDLALLRNRAFSGILTAGLLVNFAAFAALTFTSIWLQSVVGLSPLRAGLIGLPMSLFSMLASGFAGARLHGRSPRLLIGAGMALIGAGSLLCGLLLGPGASWPALLPGYAVIGLGVGLTLPVLSSSAMSAVPHSRGGMAAGSLTTARQLGHAIGIAILGTLFAARAADHLGDPAAAHAVAAGQAARLTGAFSGQAIRGAAAAGLDAGFCTAGVAGLVGALAVFLLVRPATPARHDIQEPAVTH